MVNADVDEVDNEVQQEEVSGDTDAKIPAESTDNKTPSEVDSPATEETPTTMETAPSESNNEQEPCGATANQSDEDQSNAEPNVLQSPPSATETAESAPMSVHLSDEGQSLADSVEAEPERKAVEEESPQCEALALKNTGNAAATQEVLHAEQPADSESDKVRPKRLQLIEDPTNQSEVCPPSSELSLPTLPANLVDPTNAVNEQQTSNEPPQQDESVLPENADPEEQSEVELTKPTGFMDSLTAGFAPDTKAMWAQIFGPRYDEGGDEDASQMDNQSSANSPRDSVSSKSSLQAKLDRERKLDEQIQASQRRYRERVQRNAAAKNMSTRRTGVKTSRQPPTTSPFELTGLSLTQIRICTEKALDETCKCFRHLHAAALEEAEDTVSPPVQGVFVTQWELDQLLRELFDPQDVTALNSRGRKGTLSNPLSFAESSLIAEGVSMNTQMQASWFIPFGQLPQLRSLVMKVTKRRLNEEKLAIVNRHLQKQVTLLPLSAKLQSLVVQLSNHHLQEPFDVSVRQKLRSPEELAQDLVGCIAVSEGAVTAEGYDDYRNGMLFLPVELMAKTKLSSVICAQRLVFFRFLIEIIAAERSRIKTKSTKLLPPLFLDQVPAKRKKSVGKRSRYSFKVAATATATQSGTIVQHTRKPPEAGESTTAGESLSNASEGGINDTSIENDPLQQSSIPEQVGDECEKPASQLQQQLESAIAQLRQRWPSIDSNADSLSPAIRATYLAATACQESVLLLLDDNIDIDTAMSDKLRHFIDAVQAIHIQTNDPRLPAPASPQARSENKIFDPPRFPPPYPEVDESDVQKLSDTRTVPTHFPPPYAVTSPSYWTFSPSIPEPKSSIAKLANKSPSNKSADLRSHFMSKEGPGVGAYDIQQGDKLTFQQGPSFSFGLTGDEKLSIELMTASTSLSKGSSGKPRSNLRQHMKSSLAFVPSILQQPENDRQPADARVHAASQYDDRHLTENSSDDLLDELPPHYGEGDENEAPPEDNSDAKADQVATEMDRALRLQQRFFINEFVQQVVSNQETPTHFVPKTRPSTRPSNKSKPYWATSEVSPGIERLLNRQRRAPSKSRTSSTSRAPIKSRPSKRVVEKCPPSPPRRQLDNDQHLAWAARISELYQPEH